MKLERKTTMMNTLELIAFIANYVIENKNFNTVVIGGNDDMEILEAINYLSSHDIKLQDWQVNTSECKNTILIF